MQSDKNERIQLVSRSLKILAAFHGRNEPLGISEISRRTNIPKSSTHRIVEALIENGSLINVNEKSEVMIADKNASLGDSFLEQNTYLQEALPLMQEVAEKEHISIALGQYHRGHMVCVQYCSSSVTSTLRQRIGSLVPVLDTSMGKAYLLAETPERALQILTEIEDVAEEKAHSIIQEAADFCSEHGYVKAVGLWSEELISVGTPLTATKLTPPMGLTCITRREYVEEDEFEKRVGKSVQKLANDIEALFVKQSLDTAAGN